MMVSLLQVMVEKSTTDDDGKSTTGHGGKVYYG